MEGIGDRAFRRSLATIGGFDECTSEFIRVPKNAHVPSLARVYCANDIPHIPTAAQIMGTDPALCAAMALELERRSAPRIDLNCGCPSNTVTGHGAGSSLLQTPDLLHAILARMVATCRVPVTAKIRSGFADTSLFEENLLAVQEAGCAFITIHPRTKVEGYRPPANWKLIARAKELLHIPVIGNGDILTASDALRMVQQTGCDGLMIGRGAVKNPWIFHEIRTGLGKERGDGAKHYLSHFIALAQETYPTHTVVNKLKQLLRFTCGPKDVLRLKPSTPEETQHCIESLERTILEHLLLHV